MPPTQNLAKRLEYQADHLDMIAGRMIASYTRSTNNETVRDFLHQARANLLIASQHLRSAAAYSPHP